MGVITEIVGVVTDGALVKNREYKGETFYTIKVKFLSAEIPVLFSEYVNSTVFDTDSKVKVKGCLMSDIITGSIPKFYFFANSIEPVDIDTDCSNEVNFLCTVTKVKKLTPNSRCEDILPLVCADKSPINTTSIIYLCVKGADARKLNGREKGYVIQGKGQLRTFRDVYEIWTTEISNIDEIVKRSHKLA